MGPRSKTILLTIIPFPVPLLAHSQSSSGRRRVQAPEARIQPVRPPAARPPLNLNKAHPTWYANRSNVSGPPTHDSDLSTTVDTTVALSENVSSSLDQAPYTPATSLCDRQIQLSGLQIDCQRIQAPQAPSDRHCRDTCHELLNSSTCATHSTLTELKSSNSRVLVFSAT